MIIQRLVSYDDYDYYNNKVFFTDVRANAGTTATP